METIYVVGSYISLAIFLALISVGVLAVSKSYEVSLRNIISLSTGGFIGLVVGFFIWGYAVDSDVVMYSDSSSVFWASMITSPIVVGYICLKLFGARNYYDRKLENE